jgi:hypothetical protein
MAIYRAFLGLASAETTRKAEAVRLASAQIDGPDPPEKCRHDIR